MNIRLVVSALAACVIACAIPQTACARIFPMIFITTNSARSVISAGSPNGTPSPFGDDGTIDETDGSPTDPLDFSTPVKLVQNLAMPMDVAASDNIPFPDDIIYSVIAGKGIISAFLENGKLLNSNVATVPKGRPVGIAASGNNVFVADSSKNKINEYTSSGALALSIAKGINHPNEITAAGGDLFVVNQGGGIGEYITEYNATTGQQIGGKLIQNLSGPIQIAVFGTDLFILSNHTISELDLTNPNKPLATLISGLNGSDIAAFEGQLFVTNVPKHSVDVYDFATGDLLTQITGLHGRPQGIDVVPGGPVGTPTPTPTATPTPTPGTPDQSATWLLLLLGVIVTFGLRAMVREPA